MSETAVDPASQSAEPNREYLCDPYGEIEAQLGAIQENASRINGDIRPQISIKIRPNGTFWMGCQCGLKYIAGSAATLKEASKELNKLIRENSK